MGIKEWWPHVRFLSETVSLEKYRNKRVGVDATAWMYDTARCSGMDLAKGIPTTRCSDQILTDS